MYHKRYGELAIQWQKGAELYCQGSDLRDLCQLVSINLFVKALGMYKEITMEYSREKKITLNIF